MQVPRDGLVQKLQRLSQSQQSIESVSSFCIFYSKDAHGVVQIWDAEFYRAKPERQLALLYLANHILQEGRKKGTGFQEAFFKVLPKALSHVAKHGDDKTRKAAQRMVSVWEERRVFGSRHAKSFKDVLAASMGGSSGGGGGSGSGSGGSKHAAAAAAGGGGGGAAGAAAALGPVGDALLKVKQCTGATASKNKEFSGSWSQATLDTAGLAEVSSANTHLAAYTAALKEELAARKAAVAALTAESAKQTAEISRLEGQLKSADGQQQELEQQLTRLTQQMASAVASLGQLMQQQQNGGGTTPQADAATPQADAAPGSPEAPDLELEDSEAGDEAAPAPSQPAVQAAAAAAGIDSASLAAFLQQQQQQEQQQQQQMPPQSQPQPAAAPPTLDLQALLGNPDMLSAAILSGQAGTPAGGDDMDLLLNPAPGAGGDDGGGPGAFGPDGSLLGLEQAQSGFADEGDDPYDPLEG